jgi:phage terminase large subunit-like protein
MKRKSFEQLAGHLTKAQKALRAAAEKPPFEFGEPNRPQGLPRSYRRRWATLVKKLMAARKLARTDGPTLVAYIEAKIRKDSDAEKLLAEIRSRKPFSEQSQLAAPEPTPTPALKVDPQNCAEVAKRYAADVLSGVIVAGKLVKLAAQRFINDLERTDIRFNPDACQHVENYLAGLGFRSMPWQCFCIANLYGFLQPDGRRVRRVAYIEIAKKNGKSSWLAALGLYHADPKGDAVLSHDERAQVFCAATTRYQSQSICFKEALRLLSSNDDLKARTEITKTSIWFPDAYCRFEPLAANSDKLNGLNISFGILDELGDHKTPDMFDCFHSSQVARRSPLLLSITTAGLSREQVAWYQRQHALQVLDKTIADDSYFAYIATIDEGDDPYDEACWIKANPSLGVTLELDGLRKRAAMAKAVPSTKLSFMRYNANVWPSTLSLSSWVDIDDLSKLGIAYREESEKALSTWDRVRLAEERLAGMSCIGGLDLALIDDLSVLALLFCPGDDEDPFEVLYRIWVPEENIDRRSTEHRVPYREWADQGFITATPGDCTDFTFIRAEILKLREKYHLEELGFDVHLGHDLMHELEDKGVKVVQVNQGYYLSPAIRRLERAIKTGKLCMHGHPVAGWCFSNCTLDVGALGAVRFNKAKSREKIDAAAATANCFDRYIQRDIRTPSVYNDRGILFVQDFLPAAVAPRREPADGQ